MTTHRLALCGSVFSLAVGLTCAESAIAQSSPNSEPPSVESRWAQQTTDIKPWIDHGANLDRLFGPDEKGHRFTLRVESNASVPIPHPWMEPAAAGYAAVLSAVPLTPIPSSRESVASSVKSSSEQSEPQPVLPSEPPPSPLFFAWLVIAVDVAAIVVLAYRGRLRRSRSARVPSWLRPATNGCEAVLKRLTRAARETVADFVWIGRLFGTASVAAVSTIRSFAVRKCRRLQFAVSRTWRLQRKHGAKFLVSAVTLRSFAFVSQSLIASYEASWSRRGRWAKRSLYLAFHWIAIVVVALPATPMQAFAAEYYWDYDGSATGNSQFNGTNLGGAGTWDTSGTKWWLIGAGSDTTWPNGVDTAVFWGANGTVALGTNISVGGMKFNTSGYTIDAGSNTLTFAGATNTITMNSIAAATITGAVGGSGNNVVVDGGVYGGFTAGTLTFNGTVATTGWTGATTINNGMTVEVAGSSRALAGTSGITLNGGGIKLSNLSGGNDGDRVAAVGITSNGGTITFNNQTAAANYSETLGTLNLNSGHLQVISPLRVSSGQTSQLTFGAGSLTHGASNTSTISFAGASLGGTAATPDVRNSIAIAGQSATAVIGPWATYGTSATAITDYAKYDTSVVSGLTVGIVQANIAGSLESTWTSTSNAYTITTAGQALTADRQMMALRNNVATGVNHLLLNGFKLQTYGILNGNGTNAFQISLGTPTTGSVTTPSGGGNLFLTMGNHGITINAPITDNGGAVTVVAGSVAGFAAAQTLTLTGTNTYTGGTVINSGVVSVGANANLGDTTTNAAVTFSGGGGLIFTSGFDLSRNVVVNNGAIASLDFTGVNPTVSGAVSGSGGIYISTGTAANTLSFTSSNNTFQGPIRFETGGAGVGVGSFKSLLDDATHKGAISMAAGTTGSPVFEWNALATTPLTLNNRQIDLAALGGTTTGGGTLKNSSTTSSAKMVINTDLLVTGGLVGTRIGTKLTLDGANDGDNEFHGSINDGRIGATLVPVSVIKNGAGNWIISGNNTYSNGTTVSAGTLNANSANSLGTGTVTVSGGTLLANAASSLGTGNIALSGGALTLNNKDAVNAASTLTFSAAATLNLRSNTTNDQFVTAAAILNSTAVATINVDQFSTGNTNKTLKLGPVTLSSGSTTSMTITSANGYGLALGQVTQAAGGTTATFTNTATPLTIAGYTTNSNAANSLSFVGTGTATITGNIAQSGSGALSINRATAAGTLILQGTSNMTGGVTISNGTIQTAVATNAFGNTTGISISAAGVLALRGDAGANFGNGTTPYPITMASSGATINVDRVSAAAPGTTLTLGTVSMPGAYTLNTTGANGVGLGLGAVTASTANNKIFANAISGGGKLVIASYAETDASTRTVTFQGTGDTTVNGAITQNGANALSVTMSGSGTLSLLGTGSTYTGVTTISSGVLSVASLVNASAGGTSLGASSNASTNLVFAGLTSGTLKYTGGATSTDRLFTISGGTATATIDSSGTGALTFSNTGSINTANNGTKFLTLTGNYTGAANTFAPIIGESANNSTSLTKSGAGTWILTGVNTYQGVTTITGGILRMGVNGAIGSGTTAGGSIFITADNDASATLDLNGKTITLAAGSDVTLSGGNVNSTPLLDLNGGTLNFNGDVFYTATNNPQAGRITSGTLSYGITARTINVGHSSSNNINNDVYDLTIDAQITGAPATLTYTGGGNIKLSRTDNTNDSITSLTAGTTLAVTKLADGGVNSSIGTSAAVAGQFFINDSTLKYIGSGDSTNRVFQLRGSSSTIDSSGTGALLFTSSSALGFSGTQARTLVLTGSYTGAANSFAPVVGDNTGATSLTKSGPGTWTLAGTNTYTGVTQINGGTLSVATLANGGANSNIGKSTSAASNLVLSGGTLKYTGAGGAAGTTDRLFTLTGGNAALEASGSGAVTFNNTGSLAFGDSGPHTLTLTGTNTGANTLTPVVGDAVAITGATSLVKSGSGAWVLSGTNTYTGNTTINAGTLRLGSNGSVNNSAGIAIAGGATFDVSLVSGYALAQKLTAAGSGTANVTGSVNATGRTLDLQGSGSAVLGTLAFGAGLTLNGSTLKFNLGETSGDLITIGGAASVSGTSTILLDALSGATSLTVGTYDLITAIGGGLSSGFSLGTTSLTVNSVLYNFALSPSNNALRLSVSTGGSPTTFYWTGDVNGVWNANNSGNTNWNTTPAGGVDSATVPTSTSDVVFSTTTPTPANQGTMTLGADVTIKTLTVNDSQSIQLNAGGGNTLTINEGLTVNGGAGSVTLATPINLGGAQTWTNNSSNTLTVSGAVANGGNNLIITGSGNTVISGTIGNGSGNLAKSGGGGTLTLSADNTYSGTTTITGGTMQIGNGGATGKLGGGDVTNNAALVFNRSNDHAVNNNITGTGSLTQNGTGVLTLSGSNNYSGQTFINSGVLAISSTTNIGTGAITIDSDATLRWLSGSGALSNTINAVTGATINVAAGQLTLNGTINGDFSKTGNGSLVIGGSYVGTSVVTGAGTVVANGDIRSLVTVNNGGTLKGNGSVGAITVQSGGTLSVGNSVGLLTIDGNDVAGGPSLQLNAGANLVFEFNNATGTAGNPSGGWDYIELGAGTLTLNATGIGSDKINLHIDSLTLTNVHGTPANFNAAPGTIGNIQEYYWKFIGLTSTNQISKLGYGSINGLFDITDDALNAGVFDLTNGNPFVRPVSPLGQGTFKVLAGDYGQGQGLYIYYSAIPEPGSLILAGLGALAAGWYGKRRRKKSLAQTETTTVMPRIAS